MACSFCECDAMPRPLKLNGLARPQMSSKSRRPSGHCRHLLKSPDPQTRCVHQFCLGLHGSCTSPASACSCVERQINLHHCSLLIEDPARWRALPVSDRPCTQPTQSTNFTNVDTVTGSLVIKRFAASKKLVYPTSRSCSDGSLSCYTRQHAPRPVSCL